jgi:hypothetical protein
MSRRSSGRALHPDNTNAYAEEKSARVRATEATAVVWMAEQQSLSNQQASARGNSKASLD